VNGVKGTVQVSGHLLILFHDPVVEVLLCRLSIMLPRFISHCLHLLLSHPIAKVVKTIMLYAIAIFEHFKIKIMRI